MIMNIPETAYANTGLDSMDLDPTLYTGLDGVSLHCYNKWHENMQTILLKTYIT